MSRTDTLKSLEVVLESFLQRAVAQKTDRLQVLTGINRLDDIARACDPAHDPSAANLTDQLGAWLAEHNRWIDDRTLRPGDQSRIQLILSQIRKGLQHTKDASPAGEKIATEIGRWQSRLAVPEAAKPQSKKGRRIVLRRGPESLEEAGVHPSSQDSIGLFGSTLKAVGSMFEAFSHDRKHLMSILDDTLKTAVLQKSREALLLSALIIYYLKQNGYMVEPFVKRLKEAERLHKEDKRHA